METIDKEESVKKSGFNTSQANLIVVDNFYSDPDAIREYAINNLSFQTSNYHKGKRTKPFILDGTKERLEQILGRKIANWNHPGYANGVFQYCTPEDLIVYHIDKQMFAGVVFLTPNAPLRCGTQTFKSKVNGVTRFPVDALDQASFDAVFKAGASGKEYNFYDSTHLDVVDSIANVYNRLLLWDARAIHAAEKYFGNSIHNSRLFQVFFFDFE